MCVKQMSAKVNDLLPQVGIYVFQLMDHYTAIVSIMFLAFFEVIGVCWIYGERETSDGLCHSTKQKCKRALSWLT